MTVEEYLEDSEETDLVVIGHLVEDNLGFEGVQGTLLDLSPEVVGVIHLLFGDSELEARRQQVNQQLAQAGMTVEEYLEDSEEEVDNADDFWAEI
jgi:hypothetical protein